MVMRQAGFGLLDVKIARGNNAVLVSENAAIDRRLSVEKGGRSRLNWREDNLLGRSSGPRCILAQDSLDSACWSEG